LGTDNIFKSDLLSTRVRIIILIFLFLAASGIRLYHFFDLPLDFAPNRQYHSLIIARNYYFQSLPEIPDWRKEVAELNSLQTSRREPRIYEYAISRIYYLVGGEYIWLPRLFSSIFWLVGGVFLYLIISRLFSRDGAVMGIAFYLFSPYGIQASRSFQPNSLGMMLFLLSIWALLRWADSLSKRQLVITAIFSSITLLVRPLAIFPLAAIFLVLFWNSRHRLKKILLWEIIIYFFISLVPMAIYYGYNFLFSDGLDDYKTAIFLPGLLFKPFFWTGWFLQIIMVVGWLGVAIIILGLARSFIGNRSGSKIPLAFLVSYCIFGGVFTYAIHTHSYYSLWLIPMAALFIGELADLRFISPKITGFSRLLKYAALGGVIFYVIWGVAEVKEKLVDRGGEWLVEMYRKIGEEVKHSRRTVFISQHYGKPLEYHGEVSGKNWPRWFDFKAFRIRGEAVISCQERFEKEYAINSPEYFIITAKRELLRQKELKKFLVEKFSILVENKYYIIFDLRHSSGG